MITLHHLNFSRSTRVLWLLEELGVEYDLVRYKRDARFRAPPSLAEIHPLGKGPVVVDYIAGGVSPGPFLMGEPFTLADIQMSYLLEMADYAGMLQNHATIVDYLDRLKRRPAFERALEIGGPMPLPRR